MIHKILFQVIGRAVPKARARTVRNKWTGTTHSFPPKKTAKWEEMVKLQSLEYRPKAPIEVAITLTVLFILLRPKSLPKKVKKHIKKPDCKNLVASVEDALEGIFYKNDSQIETEHIYKIYTSEASPTPKVLINLQWEEEN